MCPWGGVQVSVDSMVERGPPGGAEFLLQQFAVRRRPADSVMAMRWGDRSFHDLLLIGGTVA
jgi:hypothetical protein